MLDERSKRRSELDEPNSVPVKLADGGYWLFPKPWISIHASFANGKASGETYPVLTCGSELDALVNALSECQDNAALLCGVATLGAHMLQRQYDLTDEDLDKLFAFRPGDPESWDWAREVMAVATGEGGSRSF